MPNPQSQPKKIINSRIGIQKKRLHFVEKAILCNKKVKKAPPSGIIVKGIDKKLLNITNDDYVYTKNLIDAYINGLITFPEFLEVAPTTINKGNVQTTLI